MEFPAYDFRFLAIFLPELFEFRGIDLQDRIIRMAVSMDNNNFFWCKVEGLADLFRVYMFIRIKDGDMSPWSFGRPEEGGVRENACPNPAWEEVCEYTGHPL